MTGIEFPPGLAAVEKSDGTVVGLAFLVDPSHLLTCAHVVEAALGRPMGTIKERPADKVRIRFLSTAQVVCDCVTIHWTAVNLDINNRALEDFAVISLPPDGVPGGTPLPIKLSGGAVAFRDPVACYNVASAQRVWSYGRVGFPRPNESLQVGPDPDNVGTPVDKGCSGGPALRPNGWEVVGMIVSARLDGNAAWFTPIHVLARAWPKLRLPAAAEASDVPSLERPAEGQYSGPRSAVSLSRSWPRVVPKLIGRDEELEFINKARCEARIGTYALIGAGGEGKTAILKYWLKTVRDSDHRLGARRILAYSFYQQGTQGWTQSSADDLIDWALRECGCDDIADSPAEPWMKGQRLAEALIASKAILLLDGLEPMLEPVRVAETDSHPIEDRGLASLLHHLMLQPVASAFCLISSRLKVHDLCEYEDATAIQRNLPPMTGSAAVKLLELLGTPGDAEQLAQLARELALHPLSLVIVGGALKATPGVEVGEIYRAAAENQDNKLSRMWTWYDQYLQSQSGPGWPQRRELIRVMSVFDRPVPLEDILQALRGRPLAGLTEKLADITTTELETFLASLESLHLVAVADSKAGKFASMHPLVQQHFYRHAAGDTAEELREIHRRLFKHYSAFQLPRDPARQQLEPYYLAIYHGARAGEFANAFQFYYEKIQRTVQLYAAHRLGAFSSNLQALGHFFTIRWSEVRPELPSYAQAWAFSDVGLCLARVANYEDCKVPLAKALEAWEQLDSLKNAATVAGMLARKCAEAGLLADAERLARNGLNLAERLGEAYEISNHCRILGDMLHAEGKIDEARKCMDRAESLDWTYGKQYPYLLAQAEYRAADFYLDRAELDKASEISARLGRYVSELLDNSEYATALHLIVRARVDLTRHMCSPSGNLLVSAKSYLQQAIKMLERVDIRTDRARALDVLAQIYLYVGDVSGAMAALHEAEAGCIRAHDTLPTCEVRLSLIRAELRSEAQSEWDAIEQRVIRLMSQVDNMNYRRLLPDIYLAMADLYAKAGRRNDAGEMLTRGRSCCAELQRKTLDLEFARIEQSLG